MSRFFHTLVVVGAAISATACGGKSENHTGGEGAAGGTGGSGGSGTGGGAASGGSAATSGKGGGANGGTGGSSANGGSGAVTETGGSGGVGGGSAGTGGGVVSAGKGGTGTAEPLPEPELPYSQWDCTGTQLECVDVLGVTADQLTADCPVDETFAKSAADCAADEIYTCHLAVTVSGKTVLVNCDCEPGYDSPCAGCNRLNDPRFGNPVSCDRTLKVCECAYTGILR